MNKNKNSPKAQRNNNQNNNYNKKRRRGKKSKNNHYINNNNNNHNHNNRMNINNNSNIPKPVEYNKPNPPKISYAARIASAKSNPSKKSSSLRIRSGGHTQYDMTDNGLSSSSLSSSRSLHGNISKEELLKIRMQQKDICYVAGLPKSICSRQILGSKKWFGQFGKIRDITITDNQNCIRTNWMCVHIKYFENISAAKAVKCMNHKKLDDGRVLEANYGTQRYCEFFINQKKCHKTNCPFRHSWCKLNEIVNFNHHHQIIYNQQQQQRYNNNNNYNHNNPPNITPMIQSSISSSSTKSCNNICDNSPTSQHSVHSHSAHSHSAHSVHCGEQIRPQPITPKMVITNINNNNNNNNNIKLRPSPPPTAVISATQNINNMNMNININNNNNMSVPSTSSTDLKENKYHENEPHSDEHIEEIGDDQYIRSQTKSISVHDDDMNDINMNINDDINDMHELYEELQIAKERNKEQLVEITELRQELERKDAEIFKLKKISQSLADSHNRILRENDILKRDNIDLKKENECLKEKNLLNNKDLNLLDYTLWQWSDVYQWIISIDNGKFKKYSETIERNLKLENIDGLCIKCLSMNDIHRIGIIDYKDKQILLENIANLKSNLGLDFMDDDIVDIDNIDNITNTLHINNNHNNNNNHDNII